VISRPPTYHNASYAAFGIVFPQSPNNPAGPLPAGRRFDFIRASRGTRQAGRQYLRVAQRLWRRSWTGRAVIGLARGPISRAPDTPAVRDAGSRRVHVPHRPVCWVALPRSGGGAIAQPASAAAFSWGRRLFSWRGSCPGSGTPCNAASHEQQARMGGRGLLAGGQRPALGTAARRGEAAVLRLPLLVRRTAPRRREMPRLRDPGAKARGACGRIGRGRQGVGRGPTLTKGSQPCRQQFSAG